MNKTMLSKNRFFNTIYWKISITFLIILLILSGVYLYISVYTAEMYFQETSQKLDAEIADHIASENQCFIDGKANDEVLKKVFHNIMIINPSLEVYLLDTKGRILTYFAPDKIIRLKTVPLEPIEKFIDEKGKSFVMGVDPKNPEKTKGFSATKVYEGSVLRGYIYVILGGEEYENASQLVFGSYILRLGLRSMIITLIAAVLISFIILAFITRHLGKIMPVIRRFKNGDLNARIKLKGKDEFGEFASSFNEMADTIVQNIEDIKTMDNLRRELVANVSHDLRTPLATIQGYIETILIKEKTITEEERSKYMNIILAGTKRLKNLVEELFELSKLEAKDSKPEPEPFSITELVQDVQQKNLIIAGKKKIRLETDFSYDMPIVYGDIRMMERVLQNLIDNAIKFTHPNGKITIKLTDKKENVLVSVIDNGDGIAPEDLPHIFDRYQQGNRFEPLDNKGLGLGLAIVKKILEAHDISIDVKSSKESGTVFSFMVPVYKENITVGKAELVV